jgi:hypothetical protein
VVDTGERGQDVKCNETPQSHFSTNQVLNVAAARVVIAEAPALGGSFVFSKLQSAKAKEEWSFYLPTLWAVDLSDGTSTRDLVMRCKMNGKWHYRRATPEEEADYVSRDAW